MRIIAGKFKGRKLDSQISPNVRPTTDRVKENIFNLVQNYIKDARVLDLFAGSGAMGIEAISRGAQSCVFCDNDATVINTIRGNVSKIEGKIDIVNKDYYLCLRQLALENKKFDIIFVDPPYKKNMLDEIVNTISKYDVLSDKGVIVLESENVKSYSLNIPDGYSIFDSKIYGITKVDLLIRGNSCAITGTFDPFTIGHEYLVKTALKTFNPVHIVILTNPEKTPMFTLKQRLLKIKDAVRGLAGKVIINNYDGLAVDYCKSNGIKYIVRGARNEEDMVYESKMAKWNEEHGGIKTLIIPAISNVSSTEIRNKIKKLGDE